MCNLDYSLQFFVQFLKAAHSYNVPWADQKRDHNSEPCWHPSCFQSHLCWLVYKEESRAIPQLLSIARAPSYTVIWWWIYSNPQSLHWLSAFWPLCLSRAWEGGVCHMRAELAAQSQETNGKIFLGYDTSTAKFSGITHCSLVIISRHIDSGTCCHRSNPRSLIVSLHHALI